MAVTYEGMIYYADADPLQFRYGNLVIGPGIQPGGATLTYGPDVNYPSGMGDLTVTYGGTQITLPDCRLKTFFGKLGEDGTVSYMLRIEDRRWRWQYGYIEGTYNIREGKGNVRLVRKKNARELAEILLDAMSETGYDIDALPDDEYPLAQWSNSPASCLQRLVEAYSCRVVLDPLSDKVILVKTGEGSLLPSVAELISDSIDADPMVASDRIQWIAGRSLWNLDLELEAVGLEDDGTIKPIDDLSYKPAGGWLDTNTPPAFDEVDEEFRELAQQSVYKMYRVAVPVYFDSLGLDPIEDLRDVLPLESLQVVTEESEDDIERRVPAWVYGDWWDRAPSLDEPLETIETAHGKKPKYERGFSLDVRRGMVTFSEHVFRIIQGIDPSSSTIHPGIMFLRTAVGYRHEEDGAWSRFVKERPTGLQGDAEPIILRRDDEALHVWKEYNGGNANERSNAIEMDAIGDFYIDQELRKLTQNSPASRLYAGFIPMSPDGAIQQVTWEITPEGKCYTRASRNTEHHPPELTYREKQEKQRLKEMLEREQMEQPNADTEAQV